MNPSPAFQFYPGDFLSSMHVNMMTTRQIGAYILLLSYDWSGDGLPDDDGALRRLARLCEPLCEADANQDLHVVRMCFKPHPSRKGGTSIRQSAPSLPLDRPPHHP